MKVEAINLLSFIENPEFHFEIPYFQRNYCWKMQQIEQLIEDLKEISSMNYDHFFGSLLLFEKDNNTFEIIDGQQRFMTISLLIKSLLIYKSSDSYILSIQKMLEKMILTGDGKVKLKPQSVDEEEFLHIIMKSEAKGNTSYLATAFFGFKEAIMGDESFLKIYTGLSKLVVSMIIVDSRDQNKQTIFEKMNSLGIDLTLFDLCRNQIFFRVDKSDDLQKYYSLYWVNIERNLLNISKDEYINNFIDSRSQFELENDKRKYSVFKHIVDNELKKKHSLEELFKDLMHTSKIYANIKGTRKDYNSTIQNYLQQMRLLNVQSVYPFMMRVFRMYEVSNNVSTSVEAVIFTILTYLIRNLSIDKKTFTFNKSNYQIFRVLETQKLLEPDASLEIEAKLYNEKLEGYGGRVIRYIYRYLGMPSDSLIAENINKGIYKTGVKGKFYYSISTKDMVKINFHSLPKVKFVDTNKNYEDRLGNLCYSEEYEAYDKFIENYETKQIGLASMISNRESKMVNVLLENYPLKYNLPKKSQKLVVSINSSIDFSKVDMVSYKIQRFTSGGSKFSDLYKDIIKYCFKKNPMQFIEWADVDTNFTSTGSKPHISFKRDSMTNYMQLPYKTKTVYCSLNLSANQIIANAREMLEQNSKNVSITVIF